MKAKELQSILKSTPDDVDVVIEFEGDEFSIIDVTRFDDMNQILITAGIHEES